MKILRFKFFGTNRVKSRIDFPSISTPLYCTSFVWKLLCVSSSISSCIFARFPYFLEDSKITMCKDFLWIILHIFGKNKLFSLRLHLVCQCLLRNYSLHIVRRWASGQLSITSVCLSLSFSLSFALLFSRVFLRRLFSLSLNSFLSMYLAVSPSLPLSISSSTASLSIRSLSIV